MGLLAAPTALVACGLAALAMTAGCGAGFGPGTGGCTVATDNPHESRGSPGFIVGKARISCDVSAENVHLYVVLQQQVDGNWTDVVEGDQPLVGIAQIGRRESRQTVLLCRPGVFRTAARAKGRRAGSRPSRQPGRTVGP